MARGRLLLLVRREQGDAREAGRVGLRPVGRRAGRVAVGGQVREAVARRLRVAAVVAVLAQQTHARVRRAGRRLGARRAGRAGRRQRAGLWGREAAVQQALELREAALEQLVQLLELAPRAARARLAALESAHRLEHRGQHALHRRRRVGGRRRAGGRAPLTRDREQRQPVAQLAEIQQAACGLAAGAAARARRRAARARPALGRQRHVLAVRARAARRPAHAHTELLLAAPASLSLVLVVVVEEALEAVPRLATVGRADARLLGRLVARVGRRLLVLVHAHHVGQPVAATRGGRVAGGREAGGRLEIRAGGVGVGGRRRVG